MSHSYSVWLKQMYPGVTLLRHKTVELLLKHGANPRKQASYPHDYRPGVDEMPKDGLCMHSVCEEFSHGGLTVAMCLVAGCSWARCDALSHFRYFGRGFVFPSRMALEMTEKGGDNLVMSAVWVSCRHLGRQSRERCLCHAYRQSSRIIWLNPC